MNFWNKEVEPFVLSSSCINLVLQQLSKGDRPSNLSVFQSEELQISPFFMEAMPQVEQHWVPHRFVKDFTGDPPLLKKKKKIKQVLPSFYLLIYKCKESQPCFTAV